MRSTRVSGILIAVLLVVSILAPGDLRQLLLVGSFAATVATVVCLVVELRRGYPVRGLLVLACVSAVLYIAGGLYVAYWSPDGDIGGGLPFFLGLIGVLTLSAILSVKPPAR
jgi:hypothetical protein